LWNGSDLLAELDSTGRQRIGEYVLLGTDVPFAFISGATSLQSVSYFVRDPQGDAMALVRSDSNGTQSIREQYWQDEFGVNHFTVDSGLAKLLWQSMFYEGDSTQLYYVHARWYDPQQGRFMSEDPLGIAATRNLYTFANGDPINGHDPSGALCLFATFDTGYTCSAGGGSNDPPWGQAPLDPELRQFMNSPNPGWCGGGFSDNQCNGISNAIGALIESGTPLCHQMGVYADQAFTSSSIQFATTADVVNAGYDPSITVAMTQPNDLIGLTAMAFTNSQYTLTSTLAHETVHWIGGDVRTSKSDLLHDNPNPPNGPTEAYWVGSACQNP
jgi:RHS repeat-associated protein